MSEFLKTRFASGLLALGLIGLAFLAGRTLVQKYRVDQQIKQLSDRANDIQGQNQQLSDLVKYLNTDQYREKAAREQLNLKKDGEVVVALPQNQPPDVSAATTTTQQ